MTKTELIFLVMLLGIVLMGCTEQYPSSIPEKAEYAQDWCAYRNMTYVPIEPLFPKGYSCFDINREVHTYVFP